MSPENLRNRIHRASLSEAAIVSLLGVALSATGCSSSGGSSPVSVAGAWSGTITYDSTSTLLPHGTTPMTFTLAQSAGSKSVTFSTQPAQGNGVQWSCPEGTVSNGTISFSGPCTLTNSLHCEAQVTPTLVVKSESAGKATALTWQGYSYVWGGASCSASGISVTVGAYDLDQGGAV
jgi:hypothetical protein